jgi:hypothetical protein
VIEGGTPLEVSLIIRVVTIFTLCGYLGWKRYAMRFDNFKFFVGLFSVSQLVRIVQEHIMDDIS